MNPPADSTQEEDDAVVAELQRRVPRPGVTDLIFYPERTEGRTLLNDRDELTAEEIVDLALAYKPIQL
jgi:hypothetical protein